MIIATDVDYSGNYANAAGIVFENWEDNQSISEYSVKLDKIKKYIPGQFFKREMPCIKKILSIVTEEINCIVIDGYVWLDDIYTPGLGAVLYQELNMQIPIIGVAKKSFYTLGDKCRKIYRGTSANALYITSEGIDVDIASKNIIAMHGKYRIPSLLKKVDCLCRNWIED